MCCAFLVLVILGPRFLDIIWWIAEPQRWQATFNDQWIWPILGVIFLPWTVLMYVLVFPGGITFFEWILIGLAVLADIATYTGGGYKGYQNRSDIPGYPSGDSTPPTGAA